MKSKNELGFARELLILTLPLVAFACSERSRDRAVDVPQGAGEVRTSTLQAGDSTAPEEIRNPFEGDKEAIDEGRRLYAWMNCLGCHGELGGGGIGPPLADADWIYGGSPAVIYESIMQGRPNGMPTYRDHLTPESAWRIAAYVTSLSDGVGAESGRQGPSDQGAQQGNRR